MPGYEAEMADFERYDAQVVGISVDSVPSHIAFARSLGGIEKYPLLADFHPKGEVSRKYGVYIEEKGHCERAIVVVDKQGMVRYIDVNNIEEPAGEGIIASINHMHYSYGFTTRLRELYETTFPELADKIERSRTKLVLLTAGCPETCHRTIGNLAREIEARGVPTLIISASPAATEAVRPPRAMTFDGSEIGRIIGQAGDRAMHKRVILAALEMVIHDTPPG